jgi:phage/plasmid-like protein (TIGR03299 family)
MAHTLNIRRNGIASFVTRKEPAWHGLGTVVEAMTSKEAIELGGLNFIVDKQPLYVQGTKTFDFEEAKQRTHISREFIDNKPTYRGIELFEDKFATVRTDNGLPLGIVGSKYHVIQNHEAFEFIDSIVGERYAEYETVGALGNGETIFITCKLKAEMVINNDQIDKYLLLTMSHDGSSSIVVMFTPIRVVCNNTLSMALQAKSNRVVIRHTSSANDKLEQSKKVLGIVDQQTLAYQEAFSHIARVPVTDDEAKTIMQKVLKVPDDKYGNLSTKGKNILEAAWTYYNIGVGQEGLIGTGWGLFNGITGYLQNTKEYRTADSKFKNNLMDTTTRELIFKEIISL